MGTANSRLIKNPVSMSVSKLGVSSQLGGRYNTSASACGELTVLIKIFWSKYGAIDFTQELFFLDDNEALLR